MSTDKNPSTGSKGKMTAIGPGEPSGLSTARSVAVKLANDRSADLRNADVQAAAAELAASGEATVDADRERVRLVIGGRKIELDALALAARALNAEVDLVRPRSAVDGLRGLGFEVVGDEGTLRHEGSRHRSTELTSGTGRSTQTGARSDALDNARDLAPVPDITPELAVQLQRYRGQWVAVRQGAVVGTAATLRELGNNLGQERTSVLFVPLREKKLRA